MQANRSSNPGCIEGDIVTDIEIVATLISGPASAVVICLWIMHKGLKFVTETLLPSYEMKLSEILEEGRKDRKVFCDAVELIDRRFQALEQGMKVMRKDIGDIEREIKGLKPRI